MIRRDQQINLVGYARPPSQLPIYRFHNRGDLADEVDVALASGQTSRKGGGSTPNTWRFITTRGCIRGAAFD